MKAASAQELRSDIETIILWLQRLQNELQALNWGAECRPVKYMKSKSIIYIYKIRFCHSVLRRLHA